LESAKRQQKAANLWRKKTRPKQSLLRIKGSGHYHEQQQQKSSKKRIKGSSTTGGNRMISPRTRQEPLPNQEENPKLFLSTLSGGFSLTISNLHPLHHTPVSFSPFPLIRYLGHWQKLLGQRISNYCYALPCVTDCGAGWW
jgi:hypothetical protein